MPDGNALDSSRMSSRSDVLRHTLTQRVVVADGAMGTMLQAADPTLDDFEGHEGCNEVLNATRPDIVRSVHDAYLAVGVDCVETNTFGANLGNLGEYGIERPHPRAGPGRGPDRPGGGRRLVHARSSRGSCSAASAPAPSCPRSGTPRTRRCATPTPSRSPA